MANQTTAPAREGRLLGHERREHIVREVRQHGAVRVRELTTAFGVSDMTIRRDIEALDAANRVQKVHGGATVVTTADEPGFEAKSTRQLDEKTRIAQAAATHVAPGSAIGITAGTTTFQMVEPLAAIDELTVVTNSLPLASAFHAQRRPGLTLVVTGGSLTPSAAAVGPVAGRSLDNLHLDTVFMGVHGMGPTTGFTTPNLSEAGTNQAFVNAAVRLIVLSDSTKWGTTSLCTIAPLARADLVISDRNLAPEARDRLRDEVGDLVLV